MTLLKIPKSLNDAPKLDPSNGRTRLALHEAAHFVVAVRLADASILINRLYPDIVHISKQSKEGKVSWPVNGLPGAIFMAAGIVVAELHEGKPKDHPSHDKREVHDFLKTVPAGSPITYQAILDEASAVLAENWTVVEAVAGCIVGLSGTLGYNRTGKLVDLVRKAHPADFKGTISTYDPPRVPSGCPRMRMIDDWPYGALL